MRSLPVLLEMADDDDEGVRGAAREVLLSMRSTAVSILLSEVERTPSAVRGGPLHAVRLIGATPHTLAGLLLGEGGASSRAVAALYAATIPPPDSMPSEARRVSVRMLAEESAAATADRSVLAAAAAVTAIEELGTRTQWRAVSTDPPLSTDASQRIEKLLRGSDASGRVLAAGLLARTGLADETLARALAERAREAELEGHDDKEARGMAGVLAGLALSHSASAAAERVLGLLSPGTVRALAPRIVRSRGRAPWREWISAATHEDRKRLAIHAVLAGSQEPLAVESLLDGIANPPSDRRRFDFFEADSVDALSRMKAPSKEVTAAIRERWKESPTTLRRRVAVGAAILRLDGADPSIASAVASAMTDPAAYPSLRLLAMEALSESGTPEARLAAREVVTSFPSSTKNPAIPHLHLLTYAMRALAGEPSPAEAALMKRLLTTHVPDPGGDAAASVWRGGAGGQGGVAYLLRRALLGELERAKACWAISAIEELKPDQDRLTYLQKRAIRVLRTACVRDR